MAGIFAVMEYSHVQAHLKEDNMKKILTYLGLLITLGVFGQYTPADSVWQDGRIRDWNLWGYPTAADTLNFDSAIVTKFKMDALHDWVFDSIPERDTIVMNMIGDSTGHAIDSANAYTDELDSVNGNFHIPDDLDVGGTFTAGTPFYINMKLGVSHDTAFFMSSDTNGILVITRNSCDNLVTNNVIGQWAWQVGETTPQAVAFFNVYYDNSGGNNGSYVVFRTRKSSTGQLRNRMRIGTEGYTHIGDHVTSDATEQLQVDGNIYANGGNFIGDSLSDGVNTYSILELAPDSTYNVVTANDSLLADTVKTNHITSRDNDTITIDKRVEFSGSIETNFQTESFSASKTFDFEERNFQFMIITGTTTVNVSNLPEGVSTLWLQQNATGYTITIGTGWGTAFDNTESLGTTANANYIIQFINNGTDVLYGIVIEGE